MEFSSKQEYYNYLKSLGSFPEGFCSSTESLEFKPNERNETYSMNVSLLMSNAPCTSFAAVFTSNAICGFPVIIGRQRLKRESMQAVLVNNRIANVAAEQGLYSAQRLCEAAAERFSINAQAIFPSSTGIIGWKLPLHAMIQTIGTMAEPSSNNTALINFAESIMTTDSYPKVHAVKIGAGTILGIVKGAGMIEPNMATMLGFIVTDIIIERNELRRILAHAVNNSFNTISIDGDQSTSDMVLAFSSQKYEANLKEFAEGLVELCTHMSRHIVRNGEGTGHVIEIIVQGLGNKAHARSLARAVANSPLVKTAIYGNDPNVGRILSAIGDEAGRIQNIDLSKMSIRIGNEYVFRNSMFELSMEKEERLSIYLKDHSQNPHIKGYPQNDKIVQIVINCGSVNSSEGIIASDLGHEYVSENADYRS